jgi:polyisoprenoid-binding protein YceI
MLNSSGTFAMPADTAIRLKLAVLLAMAGAFVGRSADVIAAGPQPEPGQIDTQQSRVYVHVYKTGFGHEHGVEGQLKSGSLSLRAAQNAGEIIFDMPSFSADTDAARRVVGLEGTTDANTRTEVTQNMLGPDVLDVKKFPAATFKINSVRRMPARRPNAPQQYELAGDFTLHGATKAVKLIADTSTVNGFTRLQGSFSILQSDYGITPFSKALGAVGVADRLTISGDLWVATDAGPSK